MRFFRHRVRGTLYRDLGEVKLQASDLSKLTDGAALVLYLGENGQRHVRLKEEFHDGRFEQAFEFNLRDKR